MEKKHNPQANYSKVVSMPDYIIKITNNKDKSIKKVSIFSSCVGDAEKEVARSLKRGEKLLSITNNSFPFGVINPVNNSY